MTSSTVTIIDAASLAADHQTAAAQRRQQGIIVILQRCNGGRLAIRYICDLIKGQRRRKQLVALDASAGQEGQLSADDQKLTYQGQTVELTKNEYRILSCLMESAGKVVSREKLMQRLWETDSFVDEIALTVNVNRLRRKLNEVGLTDFITTRFGEGYLISV